MRIAYFDCFSGVSGDMILGALVDAGLEVAALRRELAKLSLPGWKIRARRAQRGGIAATQVQVQVEGGQAERGLSQILDILSQSGLDQGVVNQAQGVFSRLAQAEAKIHGIEPSEVHFHEVGATDAVVDVVGSLVGLRLLGVERIFVSPLRLGKGFLRCRHGVLPVPAPATVELLRGVPLVTTEVQAELVTPTGAAILTTLATAFGSCPPVCLERVGYGAGHRDLKEMPNVLRLLIGQRELLWEHDEVVVLESNVDDMSPELCAPLVDILLEHGALEAFLIPVVMKKGRPAVVLTALVPEQKATAITEIILKHTTTLGVRAHTVQRCKLPRQIRRVQTRWGPLRVKVAIFDGAERVSPEYEDCLRVAKEQGLSLGEVYQETMRAWWQGGHSEDRGDSEGTGGAGHEVQL